MVHFFKFSFQMSGGNTFLEILFSFCQNFDLPIIEKIVKAAFNRMSSIFLYSDKGVIIYGELVYFFTHQFHFSTIIEMFNNNLVFADIEKDWNVFKFFSSVRNCTQCPVTVSEIRILIFTRHILLVCDTII